MSESSCRHVYLYEPNAVPTPVDEKWTSLLPEHLVDSTREALGGIGPPFESEGAWVCQKCHEVRSPWEFKACYVCKQGIYEITTYSQHYHDRCAPVEVMQTSLLGPL